MDKKKIKKEQEDQTVENQTVENQTAETEEKTAEQELAEKIVELEEEIKNLNASVDDFKYRWMRNVAEFDNYKKHNSNVYHEAFVDGVSSVILKILPVGDSLDMALSLELDDKTKEGIALTKRRFLDTLKDLGVEEMDVSGSFDPNVAEAIMQVEAQEGEQPETVKQVFQKGYKLNGKIIRYAKVSVTK